MAAFWISLSEEFGKDPDWVGKEFTAADVIARAHTRAAICPMYYMIVLEMRIVELICAMSEASKNGGNHEVYCSMQRLAMYVLVVTNAKQYTELGAYDRLLWIMESKFMHVSLPLYPSASLSVRLPHFPFR